MKICYSVPQELKKANPKIPILPIGGVDFVKYGRLLEIDAESIVKLADEITTVNPEGNTYVALEPELQKHCLAKEFALYFGGSEIEVGYCNGPNQFLNSMEYHKSPELFVAVTDCIQFLTGFEYLRNYDTVHTKYTEAFYFPKGSVSILNPCAMHFSPCAVHESGFKSLIVLPNGTNNPLSEDEIKIKEESHDKEASLLFAKNKWLISHEENKRMVSRGAFVGIYGENLHIVPIQ